MWFEFPYPEVKIGNSGVPICSPHQTVGEYWVVMKFLGELDHEFNMLPHWDRENYPSVDDPDFGDDPEFLESLFENNLAMDKLLHDCIAKFSDPQGGCCSAPCPCNGNCPAERPGYFHDWIANHPKAWAKFLAHVGVSDRVVRGHFRYWAENKWGSNRAQQEYICREEYPGLWELLECSR